ncbi:hypothetical protein [Microbispora corallina]|uniref:hypothetical protein n=1 Tax=Microbispora corallina TaxID=83302 RepID=UPI00194F0860|nr:hypothetical protein [Microbispora corallina]
MDLLQEQQPGALYAGGDPQVQVELAVLHGHGLRAVREPGAGSPGRRVAGSCRS